MKFGGDAETEGCAIFVPLILGALWPEEQGNHVKPERRGELKKRKEEKAIKGKRIMGV